MIAQAHGGNAASQTMIINAYNVYNQVEATSG